MNALVRIRGRRSGRIAARPHRSAVSRSLSCLIALVVLATQAYAADPPKPPPPPAPPSPAAGMTTSTGTPTAEPTAAPTAPAYDYVAGEENAVPDPIKPGPLPMAIVPEVVTVASPPPGLLYRHPFCLAPPSECLTPFLRDADVRLHIRSFYFDRHNTNESINEAWALGGWLQATSGWLADAFQVGATLYTSQPLYAPEDHDGTLLLAPGQEGITVLGQAYGRLRYKQYAILTGYRQSINDGYVGPQDNRMIPNAFEGVRLEGTLGKVRYDAAYVWDMKPRNSDDFIPMSQQAGVAGSDEGLVLGSLNWKPSKSWELFAGDYYTPEVFNTAFGYVKYTREFSPCFKGLFGAQYTDQRSVGDELLGSFETWNAGLAAKLTWSSGLSVGAALHATGDDANIRSSYGTWPGWLSLIETDFDRANEKAAGIGLWYDFGKSKGRFHAPGLLLVLAYAHSIERENPSTGDSLPDTDELDLDVTYDIPKVKGLQIRFRNAYVEDGGEQTGYQFRVILNWEIDLL